MPGSNLREPSNGRDVHARSGIRFPFSIEYNHLFDACDLCGSCNTWSFLFWLGPSSFEMAILRTSHVVLHIGLEIPRRQGGELLRWILRLQLRLGWT